jgi:hypothetical protein
VLHTCALLRYSEHLQEFPKPTPNLDFLARLKNYSPANNFLSQLNLSALGRNDLVAQKYMRGYRSANLEMEEHEKSKLYDRVLNANV